MSQPSAKLSLPGIIDFVGKSRRPLGAVFEAIANSLEAIDEREKRYGAGVSGVVKIHLHFTGLDSQTRNLHRIEVIDNGVGFDESNFERFEMFLDRTKGYNNRGSGRVQYLHFADKIEVTSTFFADGRIHERHFFCTPTNFIVQQTCVESEGPVETTVALSELKLDSPSRSYLESLSIEALGNALKNRFLLWLHLVRTRDAKLAPVLEFAIYKNGKEEARKSLKAADIPAPATGSVEVPYFELSDPHSDKLEWKRSVGRSATLEWAHFKLSDVDQPENGVLLCSKGVAIERVPFESLKKAESIGGNRFLTAFYGDVLDDAVNVSHAVDRFTLPTRSETEKLLREHGGSLFDASQQILFRDDLQDVVEDALPEIYRDLISLKEERGRDVDAIAAAHGIDPETVRATKIGLSDTEAQITEKLFKQQAEMLAQKSLKIKQLFEELETLDPSTDSYQADLLTRTDELLSLIPEQNKQELSRYVIRRQMVAKVLGMIIDKASTTKPSRKREAHDKRQDKEGMVHDLLIKRRSATGEGPNDLWVLSEEFLHFEGFSDTPLDQIVDSQGSKLLKPISDDDLKRYGLQNKTLRRPDIFLFAEEGKCVLVELKAPDVDLSDHLTQLEKYCNLIANFAVAPLTQFYCYLIGEVVSEIDVAMRYRKDMHGDWINRTDSKVMRFERERQEEEIGEAHFEIIKLSSIHKRALRRNKSFADRLGISDEVLK